MRGDSCFERTANDARRYRFFDAAYVRVASRNISSTIPGQEYEWDITSGQSIGDPKSHFARELKIERHAVQRRIRDYTPKPRCRRSRRIACSEVFRVPLRSHNPLRTREPIRWTFTPRARKGPVQ